MSLFAHDSASESLPPPTAPVSDLPTEGLPERKGARRRQERVARMLHEFDPDTAEAIRKSLPEDLLAMADSGSFEPSQGAGGRHWAPAADAGRAPTTTLPRQGGGG